MKRILFQGDSITDAIRARDNDINPGYGYPGVLRGILGCDMPGRYECLNRGISGNRVVDLYARVKADIINLEPDILSILIGINDVWHEVAAGNGVSAKKFELVYDLLLTEIREALPDIKLIIMEPFVLPGSATENALEVFTSETALRAEAAARIARKHGAVFVPLQEAFNEACKAAPAGWWLRDGVHPTSAGHQLIAHRWLECAKEIL